MDFGTSKGLSPRVEVDMAACGGIETAKLPQVIPGGQDNGVSVKEVKYAVHRN